MLVAVWHGWQIAAFSSFVPGMAFHISVSGSAAILRRLARVKRRFDDVVAAGY